MTQEQILQLIEEYNEIEAGQDERLEALFHAIGERKGYRRVEFGGGRDIWSSCWGKTYAERPDLSIRAHVEPLNRRITGFVLGEE